MRKRLLIDTNLLVLLAVGLANEALIERHKCLAEFDRTDYLILKELIADSAGIVVTTQVLTETSNLVRQIGEPIRSELTRRLGRLILACDEIHREGKSIAIQVEFSRLGLTDAAILDLEMDNAILLTTDAALHYSVLNAGRESLNYNHIREQRPDYRRG